MSIGGGKGGSGKSFLALNLGVALAETGREVVLLDGDLGGANLHTLVGMSYPPVTLEDFLRGHLRSLEKVAVETPVRGLRLISGARRSLSPRLKYEHKRRLFRCLRTVGADYVIVDLGAGIEPFVLDLFLFTDQGILLLTPEGTAVENTYRFLRGVFFRCLRSMAKERRLRQAVEQTIDDMGAASMPWEVLKRVETMDGDTAYRFRAWLEGLRPYLVINQLRNPEERALGFSVKTVCRRYFGIELRYIGYIPFDPKVSYAVDRGRPFLREYPNTEVSRCIREIAVRMTSGREIAPL